MLWVFTARVFCALDVSADLLIASIVLTPFSHGTVNATRNHSLVLEFPDPHGVLVLGGDSIFYVETPLGWFQPSPPIWGLISMGDHSGHVQVVAQSNTTLSYAATYFNSSCDSLSVYSSAMVVLENIPANVTQCVLVASTNTTVTVTGTLPAAVNFTRPGPKPVTALPRDGLTFGFSDGPFVIVRAEANASSDITFSFGGSGDNNIGTLVATDAKFGIFQGDRWVDFIAMGGTSSVGAESRWSALGYTIVLGIIVLIMVFALAIILPVMLVRLRWRKTGDSHARTDLAPDFDALRDIEHSKPEDGAASDSTGSKDDHTDTQEAPDNPYDLFEQPQGLL
jgi:hypothetical protein